jgi:hypothetical protein
MSNSTHTHTHTHPATLEPQLLRNSTTHNLFLYLSNPQRFRFGIGSALINQPTCTRTAPQTHCLPNEEQHTHTHTHTHIHTSNNFRTATLEKPNHSQRCTFDPNPQRFCFGIGSALTNRPTRTPAPQAHCLLNEQHHTHIQQLWNLNSRQTQPLTKQHSPSQTLATNTQ